MPDEDALVLGIDVGTGSARAGLFTPTGVLAGRGEHPLAIWKQPNAHVEQSSRDIWQSVGRAVRNALADAQVDARAVTGIGFDATCSLVAVGAEGQPVTVSLDGDDDRDVVVWMDHRATTDAAEIDATQHPVLRFVGGSISPEMQTPKLRWLQRELPDTWARAIRWFDLPDYLTWRATGVEDRSLCSVTCKWTYLAHERRWDDDYFARIGLADLTVDDHIRIGRRARVPGERLGGLAGRAADDLGLRDGTPVAASLIDAHAGALGMLGASGSPVPIDERVALIAGTSACHLAVSSARVDIDGVWGPYYEVLFPDRWLTEAGISASGAFLDHAVRMHPAAARLGPDPFAELDAQLHKLGPDVTAGAAHRHWQPNLLGNRAPLADPDLTGAMAGVTLRDDIEDLALWYLAALQALAYATRHIIEAFTDAGKHVELLVVCGGTAANEWWRRAHADALGIPVACLEELDAVLLGAAVLGAVAAGYHASTTEAVAAMTRFGATLQPNPASKRYHDTKFGVYRRMIDDSLAYRAFMLDH